MGVARQAIVLYQQYSLKKIRKVTRPLTNFKKKVCHHERRETNTRLNS